MGRDLGWHCMQGACKACCVYPRACIAPCTLCVCISSCGGKLLRQGRGKGLSSRFLCMCVPPPPSLWSHTVCVRVCLCLACGLCVHVRACLCLACGLLWTVRLQCCWPKLEQTPPRPRPGRTRSGRLTSCSRARRTRTCKSACTASVPWCCEGCLLYPNGPNKPPPPPTHTPPQPLVCVTV